MAVGVLERENVVAFGERIEICVIFQEAFGHISVKGLAAALIGKE
jgi:hypothetical protein